MNKNGKLKVFLICLSVLIVLICGIYGYSFGEEYDIINALWYTIKLFFGDAGPYSNNLFVNIAKFGALIISASFVISLVNKLSESISDFFAGRKRNSIFVYGDSDYSREFINSAKNTIINRPSLKKASKYVLLSDDEDNMSFYENNKDFFKNKTVYIKNSVFSNTIIGDHHFFSLEQIAARKYWRENSLIECAFDEKGQPKKELTISVIGNTPLSEHILFEAVITNIFDAQQKVSYHLFGDWGTFIKTHINSGKLGFVYHETDYLDNLDVVSSSDVVLFFNDDRELNSLLQVLPQGNIVVFTASGINEELFEDLAYGRNNRIQLKVFNYLEGICNEDEIINERSLIDAKKLNYNYYLNVGGDRNSSINDEWAKLSSFHKLSNLACVDYYNFTVTRLLEKLTRKKYSDISDKEFERQLENLSELEHIRWCNFHYFCNWVYSPQTDKKAKIHNCLVSYDKLSREEQLKDAVQLKEIRGLKEKLE